MHRPIIHQSLVMNVSRFIEKSQQPSCCLREKQLVGINPIYARRICICYQFNRRCIVGTYTFSYTVFSVLWVFLFQALRFHSWSLVSLVHSLVWFLHYHWLWPSHRLSNIRHIYRQSSLNRIIWSYRSKPSAQEFHFPNLIMASHPASIHFTRPLEVAGADPGCLLGNGCRS